MERKRNREKDREREGGKRVRERNRRHYMRNWRSEGKGRRVLLDYINRLDGGDMHLVSLKIHMNGVCMYVSVCVCGSVCVILCLYCLDMRVNSERADFHRRARG